MRRLTGLLLAGALVLPATLIAQGPPAGPRMRMGDGPMMGAGQRGSGPGQGLYNPQMLINRRAGLELSEAQVKQLETLSSELRQAHDKAEAEAKPHEEKLRELWQADQPNVQAIQTEMKALMAARQAASLTAVATTAKAKALLTAEQRGRVQGWAQAGRAFRGDRMDGPRRGAGFRGTPRMRR